MSDRVYRLDGVTKVYGNRSVLRIDELDVFRGEILALVGPSGAGKSTLLRLLNFLEPPTTGTVRFLDAELTPQRQVPLEVRRRVATVFQRPVLLSRNVSANVRYGLQLRGRRDGRSLVEETLERVGLEELKGQHARTLSGGEAQRVSLARALVLQPEVMLLDEPTANLDPYNVGLIEGIVKNENRARGTTMVLVTHNVFQAKRLAHRVALLIGGQLVEVAETSLFFDRPSDERTAAFVRGDMIY